MGFLEFKTAGLINLLFQVIQHFKSESDQLKHAICGPYGS